MWNIGDNLSSKINSLHTGYYTIIEVGDNWYKLRAMERNGTPTFPDDKDKYGVFVKKQKWCHKNMNLLPPRPKEVIEDEMDFIDPLDCDFWE